MAKILFYPPPHHLREKEEIRREKGEKWKKS